MRGLYREGKCDVIKIQLYEYGIGLHIQKGFIWSRRSKTVVMPSHQFALKG